MVDSLPLPPPQVPLFTVDGRPTQQGFEFLDRLQSLVKQLKAVSNIFDGLTATQSTALLDLFTSTLKGVVPGSGGGTANFLRADGSWAAPPTPASGGLTLLSSASVGAGTTYSVTGLGGYKAFFIALREVQQSTSSQSFQVALSGDNGSTFGTAQIVTSAIVSGTKISGHLFGARMDQTNNQFIYQGAVTGGLTIDTSSRGPINALRFSWAAAAAFTNGALDIYGLK